MLSHGKGSSQSPGMPCEGNKKCTTDMRYESRSSHACDNAACDADDESPAEEKAMYKETSFSGLAEEGHKRYKEKSSNSFVEDGDTSRGLGRVSPDTGTDCASLIGLRSNSLSTSLNALEPRTSDSVASTIGSNVLTLTPSTSVEDVTKILARKEEKNRVAVQSRTLDHTEMTVIDLEGSTGSSKEEGSVPLEENTSDIRKDNVDHGKLHQQEDGGPPEISESLGQQTPVSSESSCCRICHTGGSEERLVSPCYCTGTVGKLHVSCLETWLSTTNRSSCELCSYVFPVERVPPPLRRYLFNITTNSEFANFIHDIACFAVLTPLLGITGYMCIDTVSDLTTQGKRSSTVAYVVLIISLVSVYLSWAVLAFLYHYRVWTIWKEGATEVRVCRDKLTSSNTQLRGPGPSGSTAFSPPFRYGMGRPLDAVSEDAQRLLNSPQDTPSRASEESPSILLKPVPKYNKCTRHDNMSKAETQKMFQLIAQPCSSGCLGLSRNLEMREPTSRRNESNNSGACAALPFIDLRRSPFH